MDCLKFQVISGEYERKEKKEACSISFKRFSFEVWFGILKFGLLYPFEKLK